MRDETRDVWVFEDGGDCLGVTEYEHHLESVAEYGYDNSEGERYVPHEQLVEAEHSASVHREMFCEAADAETKCRAELIETRKQLAEVKERATFAERARDGLTAQLALYSELERHLTTSATPPATPGPAK